MKLGILLLILFVFQEGVVGDVDVVVKLYRFESCRNDTNAMWSDVNVIQVDRNKMELNATITINNDIANNYEARIDLVKCKDQQTEDSCEHYFSATCDLCQHMSDKEQLWTPLVEFTQNFDGTCPVKKGVYNVENAPVNLDCLKNYPNFEGFYKITTVAMSEGKEMFCLQADVDVRTKKKKKEKQV